MNCKPTSTPMDCGTRLEKAKPGDSRIDKELYQSKIGSLLYLAMGTRPDIAHTVNVLSQYCMDPSTIHNSSVHHLFRYLKGSMHYKLIYKPVGSPSLKLYSDASFANSLDDRRSYTGFVAFYGESVVCWSAGEATKCSSFNHGGRIHDTIKYLQTSNVDVTITRRFGPEYKTTTTM
ncbi:hypothetical protein JTB14_032006 [Gonioctena quinquepunctata]|nr:hypothetical protein JTB14_032006 [Gonioctena quinquepunctata]